MKQLLFFWLFFASVFTFAAPPFPDPSGYVMDTAGILSSDAELEQLLEQLEHETTAEIAIVTIPTLDGQDIAMYSIDLAEHLKVGKEDTDNGLIILIVDQDRQYRIEVGYGLEGSIPDAVAGRMGREILVPAFRERNYDAGVKNAIHEIRGLLQNDPSIISKYNSGSGKINPRWIYTLILIFIVLSIIMSSYGNRGRNSFFGIPPLIGGGSGGFGSGGFGGFGSGGFGGFGGGGFGGGGAGGRF